LLPTNSVPSGDMAIDRASSTCAKTEMEKPAGSLIADRSGAPAGPEVRSPELVQKTSNPAEKNSVKNCFMIVSEVWVI